MKILNDEQIFFMKDLLQHELVELKIRRGKAESVEIFDEIYNGRIEFIRDLIKHLDKMREQIPLKQVLLDMEGDNDIISYCAKNYYELKL